MVRKGWHKSHTHVVVASTDPCERNKKFKNLNGVALPKPLPPKTATNWWTSNCYLVTVSMGIGQKMLLFVLV